MASIIYLCDKDKKKTSNERTVYEIWRSITKH